MAASPYPPVFARARAVSRRVHQTRHAVPGLPERPLLRPLHYHPRGDVGTRQYPHLPRDHLLIHSRILGDPSASQNRCGRATVVPKQMIQTRDLAKPGESPADSLRDTSRVTARLLPRCRKSHVAVSATRRVTTESFPDTPRHAIATLRHHNRRRTKLASHRTAPPFRRLARSRARSTVHDGASERNLSDSSTTLRRLHSRVRHPSPRARTRRQKRLGGSAFATRRAATSARSTPPRRWQPPAWRLRRLEQRASGSPAPRAPRQLQLLRRQRLRRQPARRPVGPCRQHLARLRRAPPRGRDTVRDRVSRNA